MILILMFLVLPVFKTAERALIFQSMFTSFENTKIS